MIRSIVTLLLVLYAGFSAAQGSIDSLKKELRLVKYDTAKVRIYWTLAGAYSSSKPDSSFYFSNEGRLLSRRINYPYGEAWNIFEQARYFRYTGQLAEAAQLALDALVIFQDVSRQEELSKEIKEGAKEGAFMCKMMTGWTAQDQEDYSRALDFITDAAHFGEQNSIPNRYYAFATLAEIHLSLSQQDSALYFANKADMVSKSGEWSMRVLAAIHARLRHDSLAIHFYNMGIKKSSRPTSKAMAAMFTGLGSVLRRNGRVDSALYYGNMALRIAADRNYLVELVDASELLATIYSDRRLADSTLKYMQIKMAANDSLFSQEKIRQLQNLFFNETLRQQQLKDAETRNQNKVRTYVLSTALGSVLIVAIILLLSIRSKNRINQKLEEQKAKVESVLVDLKATQHQLIHREKMASLGSLTAGIAHEIQNPLNFVNNFSEVNHELLAEMKSEIEKENYSEAKAIAKSITDNEEKIIHHGKRADAIVKSMLQHSRSSSGAMEPTDINALVDEYSRLAYHGLRAKDTSFKATMKTDFNDSLNKVDIVRQDIGRVVLNLVSNAFYAVAEMSAVAKARLANGETSVNNAFEPTVTISTRKESGFVLISVKDNGNGIPQNVIDKIFQPFFTTKPTGQGTGLGLSLSYDIVKAHGGELKVKTKHIEALAADLSVRNAVKAEASAEAGSEFIIQLRTS